MSHNDCETPDCDDALANLYEYLDSEMEDAEASQIREHLDDCSGCHSRFDFETRLRIVVRERLSEEVPPEFIARLRSALERETSTNG
jgi:anti-sigma factor (TIGR02949 family)